MVNPDEVLKIRGDDHHLPHSLRSTHAPSRAQAASATLAEFRAGGMAMRTADGEGVVPDMFNMSATD